MVKTVGIIVDNWNSGDLTNTAVQPYLNYHSDKIKCEVVVVDNASSDNSLSILRNPHIILLANSTNTGFGHACNQAFEKLHTDYILLLNPDTISSVDTLETLVSFLENNHRYAVTGPMQKYENGSIIRCCGRFPVFRTALYDLAGLSKKFPKHFTPAPIMLDFDHLSSRDVDHIMGSYMLIRKSTIDITGFMDTAYFVYGEDLDLSKRIAIQGFSAYYNSNCSIIHISGASGHKVSALRLFYSISSRWIYWKKYLSYSALFVLTFLSLTLEPLLRLIQSPLQASSVLKAYRLYIKKIIGSRKMSR
jgi:GT2 family glycosyltransferase